ncbi:AraC family transcriptional regulator ligand-binding domain-containing protein [Salinisphaera sp. T31B1]|uniref:AraC family transcriptional regulator n=1 Tax=Salinisphaera sp. T31B1 TaxID=727963 RepID=UPI00333E40C9
MTSLVRNSALDGFGAFVRQLGGEPELLLARCDIPPDIESRQDAFLSYRSLIQLLEECADRLSCPDFGMRLAGTQGIGILGPLAVVIRHSSTVAEAIDQAARYLHVFNPGQRVTARRVGSALCLRFEILLEHLACPRQANERALVFLKRLTELGGNAPLPTRILFAQSRLAPMPAYKRFFGDTSLCFEQPVCGLDIEARAMQASLRRSDRHIRSMAIAFLEHSDCARDRPITARVREIVRRLLPTGQLGIDLVAESLHLQRRTLQRRLDGEDTTFAVVLDGVRRELAIRYLSEHDMPFSQVASLLGYTEQSALNRACQRWFETTPSQYRRRTVKMDH